MNITINRKPTIWKFSWLEVGNLFTASRDSDDVFIKTNGTGCYNAVSLKTGYCKLFSDDAEVTIAVNAHLVVDC